MEPAPKQMPNAPLAIPYRDAPYDEVLSGEARLYVKAYDRLKRVPAFQAHYTLPDWSHDIVPEAELIAFYPHGCDDTQMYFSVGVYNAAARTRVFVWADSYAQAARIVANVRDDIAAYGKAPLPLTPDVMFPRRPRYPRRGAK